MFLFFRRKNGKTLVQQKRKKKKKGTEIDFLLTFFFFHPRGFFFSSWSLTALCDHDVQPAQPMLASLGGAVSAATMVAVGAGGSTFELR